ATPLRVFSSQIDFPYRGCYGQVNATAGFFKQLMAKLHLITYGCQMNEYDSERVAGLLAAERYELTQDEDDADLILVNTCAIREKAEDKVFSKLGELRKLKERKPELIIGVMGCMAQLPARNGPGGGAAPRRRGVPRGDAPRPDGQRLRARPDAVDRPGRAPRAGQRRRGDRADPVHHLQPVQPHAPAHPRAAGGAEG